MDGLDRVSVACADLRDPEALLADPAVAGHLDFAEPIAQITTLLVAPDDRRRGLGRLLLKAAAQAARTAGCDGLEMVLPPDRPDLEAFCAATGFVAAGTRLTRPLRKRSAER